MTSKKRLAAASCSSSLGEIFRSMYNLYTNKNALCVHLVFLSCLFSIHSTVEDFTVFGPRSVWSEHTPEAVGSRHLCFESQHSYYGFHVACKVLCICFDQSLFGVPSHIKMLGIHLLRTNKPCRVLFLKRDLAVKDGGFDLNSCHF